MRDADVVVDTHVWIWSAAEEDARIGRSARRALRHSSSAHVPVICQMEAATMFEAGRMDSDIPAAEWLEAALAVPPFAVSPLTPRIAATAAALGREGFHGDPADRMIYATARVLDVPLLSADRRIRDFDRSLPRSRGRRVVWD